MIVSASEKYELAKARAIYGTRPKDYIIMAYILSLLEDALSRRLDVDYALSGLGAASRMVKRLVKLSGKCPWAAMLDYKDFNIQHTLSPDYVRAANWCAGTLHNSWIRFPGIDGLFKCQQGLFSGMRGTSFVNTILNIAYHRAGVRITRLIFPKINPTIYATQQGDDLWLCSSSRVWNILHYHVMSASGLVFEPSKQLFSHGIGEFLRVLYCDNKVYGYLGRLIASLVISPLQGKTCEEKISTLRELDLQIKTLVRRGLKQEIACLLWYSIVEYRAIKSSDDIDDSINHLHLTRHSMYGGVGCSPPFQRTHIGIKGSVPTMSLFTSELIDSSASYMSSDLYTAFHDALPDSADAIKTALQMQDQALDALKKLSPTLYNAALQKGINNDKSLQFPITFHGPVETLSPDNFQTIEGDYTDTTNVFEKGFNINVLERISYDRKESSKSTGSS
ncbi:hypothetical protein GJ496_009014 [Pomphorhynchus laevis]|nr:hypothetical protein GJ496_009014 [Pomphorhynchus laevis]